MEYTKDIIFTVSYGQEVKKSRFRFLERISRIIGRHKMITTIVSITLMLMILDCILIGSFINVLNNLQF